MTAGAFFNRFRRSSSGPTANSTAAAVNQVLAGFAGLLYTFVSMFKTYTNAFRYFGYWYWSFAPSQ
jgi:hypothetical protein